MFKQYRSYTHSNMLDVKMLVLAWVSDDNNDHLLKVRWFTKRGILLGYIDEVVVKTTDVMNWSEI